VKSQIYAIRTLHLSVLTERDT